MGVYGGVSMDSSGLRGHASSGLKGGGGQEGCMLHHFISKLTFFIYKTGGTLFAYEYIHK